MQAFILGFGGGACVRFDADVISENASGCANEVTKRGSCV